MLPLIDGKEPWAEDRGGGLCKSSNGEGHEPVDGGGDRKGDDISRRTWKDDKHSTSVLSSNGADDVSTRDIVRQGQLTPAPASTSSASSSSSPSSSRAQNISTIHRRSFYEKHEDYGLIFIPELCHAADKLQVRTFPAHAIIRLNILLPIGSLDGLVGYRFTHLNCTSFCRHRNNTECRQEERLLRQV